MTSNDSEALEKIAKYLDEVGQGPTDFHAKAMDHAATLRGVLRKRPYTAPKMTSTPLITLHLKTQRNQPYGSERRCCERCGIMLWGQENEPTWTDEPTAYDSPPTGFITCEQARKKA